MYRNRCCLPSGPNHRPLKHLDKFGAKQERSANWRREPCMEAENVVTVQDVPSLPDFMTLGLRI
jgi:hypothetical protein